MLEKVRNVLSVVVIISGLAASIMGFMGGFVVTPAEAEELEENLMGHIGKLEKRVDRLEEDGKEGLLIGLKTQYHVMNLNSNLTESQKLELQIVKNKILDLEKVIASQ